MIFQPWLYKLKMNEEKVNRSDSTAIRDQVKIVHHLQRIQMAT
jgi:hypothetical protein